MLLELFFFYNFVLKSPKSSIIKWYTFSMLSVHPDEILTSLVSIKQLGLQNLKYLFPLYCCVTNQTEHGVLRPTHYVE